MTVETEVAALTSAVNLLTSTVNVSKATLDASVAAAEAAYDSFDDRYLGAKVSAPSLDNDGGSLLTGALYFNSTENAMYVYTGASWVITTNYNNVTAPYTLAQTLNTNGNNVTFGDNGKATFGAGSDLQIYHDGSHSLYCRQRQLAVYRFSGVNLNYKAASASKAMLILLMMGLFTFTYNNSAKLATTATGIDVTGTATMDGLTVAGAMTSGDITIDADDTPSLKFEKATGSDVLASINVSTDAGTGGKLAIQTKRNGNSAVDRVVINDDGNVSFYEDTGTTPKFVWDSAATRLTLNGAETTRSSNTYLLDIDNSIQTSNLATSGPFRLKGYYGNSLTVSGAGDISFYDDAGAAKLFWDASAESLGIGTSSPVSLIEAAYSAGNAVSDSRAITISTDGGYGTYAALKYMNLDFAGISDNIKGRVQVIDRSGSTSSSEMSFSVSNSSNVLTQAMLINAVGNVGIGTSAPARTLHVNSAGVDAAARFESTDGTTAIEFVDSATTSNPNLGAKANDLFFATGGAERMRIDSSGNVLVGKTSNSVDIVGGIIRADGLVNGCSDSNYSAIFSRNTNDGDIVLFRKDGTTVGSIGTEGGDLAIGNDDAGIQFVNGNEHFRPFNMTTKAATDALMDIGSTSKRFKDLYLSGGVYANALIHEGDSDTYVAFLPDRIYMDRGGNRVFDADSGSTRFGRPDGAEAMRIDSSGNLLVGNTVTPSSNNQGAGFINTGASGLVQWQSGTTTTSGVSVARFYNPNGNVGSIQLAGTATSYITSSDQRLKENIADADDAGSKVDAIKVRQFYWKADGSHQDYGMIAQELQAVAPEAVSGDADSEEMMGVDYSKLVPMLIKEIQSLRNRVAQLEA